MRQTGFDMWLVINREYVEDPVYLSLVPAPVFHARRLSMLVFFDRGESEPLEILTVSRYPMDGYTAAWQGGNVESQWTQAGRNRCRAKAEAHWHQHEPPMGIR